MDPTSSRAPLHIGLKRAYEARSDDDGLRILVERLWPRGLSRADAAVDCWMKDIAPSPQLRTWFGHRAERWDAFRRCYRAELARNRGAVDRLEALCAGRKVTLVFAARSPQRNSAVALREYLLSRHG